MEASRTSTTLKGPKAPLICGRSTAGFWRPPRVASTEASATCFPSGAENDLAANYNRAGLSWYTIDPILQSGINPDGQMSTEDKWDHRARQVQLQELYKFGDYGQSSMVGRPTNLPTLDLTYRPTERVPTTMSP